MRKIAYSLLPCVAALVLSGCSADVQRTLDSGQRLVEPVVEALSTYHANHANYPTNLSALVTSALLKSIPTLPEKRGTRGVFPLCYEVAPDGSFYYLHFGYDFPTALWAEAISRFKISYEPDWGTRSYPPDFQHLVAHRVGARFQNTGAADALDIAVAALAATAKRGRSADCINLSRALVAECIGVGAEAVLPHSISPAKGPTALYSSSDSNTQYCFTYVHKNDEDRPKHGYFLKDSHVADVIYRITRTSSGETEWSVLEQCR